MASMEFSAWLKLHEEATTVSFPRFEDIVSNVEVAEAHELDAQRVVKELAEREYSTFLGDPCNRSKLRRVLMCFAAWNPRCGVNREFSSFVASLMFSSGDESDTFDLSVRVYNRLKLDDYFVDPWRQDGLQNDVVSIIHMLEQTSPNLVHVLEERECVDSLESVIETYLKSLTASGFSGKKHGAFGLVHLLHRVVTRWGLDSDPRRVLRWMVFSILCTHVTSLECAALRERSFLPLRGRCFLRAVEASRRYRVDDALLAMIDSEVDALHCKRVNAMLYSLPGFALGALLGLGVGSSVAETLSTWSHVECISGVLGGCAGAGISSQVGWDIGEEIALAQTIEASERVITDTNVIPTESENESVAPRQTVASLEVADLSHRAGKSTSASRQLS